MTNVTKGGTACGQTVRIISLNTGGLNAAIKRTKIVTHIKNLNADIMFLQETHLCNADHRKFYRPWIDQTFRSHFNAKARGTAILIQKNVHFTPDKVTL